MFGSVSEIKQHPTGLYQCWFRTRGKMQFEEVDSERAIKEWKIKSDARDMAQRENIGELVQEADTPQKKIVQNVTLTLEANRDRAKQLEDSLEEERSKISTDILAKDIKSLPKEVEGKLNAHWLSEKDKLIEVAKDERKALVQLRRFKADHFRKNDAAYPDSATLHWSLLVLAVLVESMANSYFFSKDSDLGLLGGLFQAILISGLNVGLAALSGANAIRLLFHIDFGKKFLGFVWLALNGAIFFVVNALAAHYRSQLSINIETAAINAVTEFVKNPLGFTVFDAWVLFGMGLIFSTAAALEGFRSDDPYPGYGKLDRNHKKHLHFADLLRREFLAHGEEIFHQAIELLNTRINDLQVLIRQYRNSVEQSKRVKEDFEQSCENNEKICNYLIHVHRDEIKRIQEDYPIPAYFETQFKWDKSVKTLNNFNVSRAEKKAAEYEAMIDHIGATREEVKELLDQKLIQFLAEVKDYFKEIANKAKTNAEIESSAELGEPTP